MCSSSARKSHVKLMIYIWDCCSNFACPSSLLYSAHCDQHTAIIAALHVVPPDWCTDCISCSWLSTGTVNALKCHKIIMSCPMWDYMTACQITLHFQWKRRKSSLHSNIYYLQSVHFTCQFTCVSSSGLCRSVHSFVFVHVWLDFCRTP